MKFTNLLLLIIYLHLAAFAADRSDWRLHPSFDCTPVKIIDTPENTYFIVHQQIFDKSIKSYDFPSLTIFYQDKKGDEKIIPLTDISSLSSSDIRIVTYSKSLGSLIIGYNSGSVDIVDSQGKVRNIDMKSFLLYPGESRIRNIISPDYSNDLIICNDSGYIVLDGSEANIKVHCVIGKPVDAIFKVGEHSVMNSGGELFISDRLFPDDMKEFCQVHEMTSVLWAAPLGSDTFVLVKGISGGTVELLTGSITREGSVSYISRCKDQFVALSANESVVDRYECNFIPNREGYLLYSGSKAWQLGNKGENDFSVTSLSLDKSYYPLGSWDFKTFITYHDRGKFIKKVAPEVQDHSEWKEAGEAIRPEAPAAFICTKMDYSENHGLLMINHGAEQLFQNIAVVTPSLLSMWNSNRWTIFSNAYSECPPRVIADKNEYQNLWKSYRNRYPLSDPTGFVLDPINSDIAIISSTFGGVVFQNINNSEKVPLRICSPTDPLAKLPGSIPVMKDQNWASFCSFSAPEFDADSTLWLTYLNLTGSRTNGEGTIQLKFMTKDKRQALYSTPLESLPTLDLLGTINISYFQSTNGFSEVLPFKHVSSRNYVLADLQLWDKGMFIVNHKGTLGDSSDDEVRFIRGYITPDGRKMDFTMNWRITEDPLTGYAIVAYYNGLATFHPAAEVTKDGYICGRDISVLENGERVLPSVCHVNNVIYDTFGRMWIATENQGVICVSEDRERVEYRLTEVNSPLPSDRVYGLGWNPVTSSIMISTRLGLVEFTPGGQRVDDGTEDVLIYPDKIRPDYYGEIAFRNIPFNTKIIIRDKTGKEVAKLFSGSESTLYWNMKNTDGIRIASGVYTVEVEGISSYKKLIVLSPR